MRAIVKRPERRKSKLNITVSAELKERMNRAAKAGKLKRAWSCVAEEAFRKELEVRHG